MKGERGYTLVEMLVTLVIIGTIAGVLGFVVQQIATVPEKSNDQVAALHALQNVIHWVGQDAESAASATGGESLSLTFPDDTEVSYELSGTALNRFYNGESQTVATNITSLSFTVSDRVISMTITAAPESRWDISESQTYQVAMRPSGT